MYWRKDGEGPDLNQLCSLRVNPHWDSLQSLDAIDFAQDAERNQQVGSLEVVGRGRPLRRLARTAVSAGRAVADLAIDLRMVCPGSAALGPAFTGLCGAAASLAPRLPARLSLRSALVRRQLLLGPRHDEAVWRYAAGRADAAAAGLQPLSGALLWLLRSGSRSGAPGHGQHAPRAHRRALPVGRHGAGRRAHHQLPLGSTRLLASGQCTADAACTLDRRLRDQLCAGGSECAADGWPAAQPSFTGYE